MLKGTKHQLGLPFITTITDVFALSFDSDSLNEDMSAGSGAVGGGVRGTPATEQVKSVTCK